MKKNTKPSVKFWTIAPIFESKFSTKAKVSGRTPDEAISNWLEGLLEYKLIQVEDDAKKWLVSINMGMNDFLLEHGADPERYTCQYWVYEYEEEH